MCYNKIIFKHWSEHELSWRSIFEIFEVYFVYKFINLTKLISPVLKYFGYPGVIYKIRLKIYFTILKPNIENKYSVLKIL